jgi:hypothetical protein
MEFLAFFIQPDAKACRARLSIKRDFSCGKLFI